MRKCEQNVTEHEDYKEKYSVASRWVEGARSRYSECSTLGNTRTDLQTKQQTIHVSTGKT